MADPPPYPDLDLDDDTGVRPGREPTTRTPRWVKASAIVAVVLLLLIGGLMVFGGGSHGPGRHTGSGDAGRQAPAGQAPSGDDLGGHTPPAGGH